MQEAGVDLVEPTQVMPGLLYGYLLDGGGGGQVLSRKAIDEWQPSQGVRWLHFNYRDPGAQEWICQQSGLSSLITDALLAEDTRPRATFVDDGLLIALRGVNLTPGADPDDMVSIRLWIDQHQIITTRMRSLFSVGDIVEQIENRSGPANGAEFLVELADRLVWRMSDTVDQFEDDLADMEERIITADNASQRYELANLRRQVITLRRYLAPQREAFGKLVMEKHGLLGDSDRARLRESTDQLLRHVEDLDAVRERAAVAQEELLSRLSEQTNARMYMLSIVAAIFLPLSFLTGLLGINVAGIPGAEYPHAFAIFALILMALVSAQIFYFYRRGWL